jgi:hypothetical protein
MFVILLTTSFTGDLPIFLILEKILGRNQLFAHSYANKTPEICPYEIKTKKLSTTPFFFFEKLKSDFFFGQK